MMGRNDAPARGTDSAAGTQPSPEQPSVNPALHTWIESSPLVSTAYTLTGKIAPMYYLQGGPKKLHTY